MFRQSTLILAAILCLLVTACAQQQEVLPTLVPTFTTEPPPQAETATPLPTQIPAQDVERPTLPPTWTPTTEPATPALAPTATFDQNLAQGIPAYADTGACDVFRADLSRSPSEVTVGSSVQVFWGAVVGVTVYQITLFDGLGAPLQKADVMDTTYTFTPDVFEGPGLYAWEVIPYDANGLGMCPPRGSELRLR